MITSRVLGSLLGCIVLNFELTTCQSPGESDKSTPKAAEKPRSIELAGVDTKDLTPREKTQWSGLVSELLAPCESTPGTIAECVEAKKDCAACVPAASYLAMKVRAGLTKPQVEASYRARFSSEAVKRIAIDGSPSQGPTDAAVTIVEWADFECPACRAAFPIVEDFVKKNPDIRFVFKNFPLEMHQNAESAAKSAMAAHKQGKFWPMHHELFSSPEPLTPAHQLVLAKKVGVEIAQFEKDQKSEAVFDAVSRDKKQGRDVELAGTPTIYINGRYFTFTTDLGGELAAWVSLERTLLGRPAPKEAAPADPVPAGSASAKAN